MFCKECGTEIKEGFQICPKCGVKLKEEPAPQTQEATNLSADALGGAAAVEGVQAEQKKSSKGKIAAVIIALLVVAAAAVFAVPRVEAMINGNSSTSEESESSEGKDSQADTSKEKEGSENSSAKEEATTKASSNVPDFAGFVQASASSSLPTGGRNTKSYVADNVIDGNTSTTWSENDGGSGIGEYLILSCTHTQLISGFTIYAGYQESDYLYSINNRPKAISVYSDDGSFVGSWILEDAGRKAQEITFDEPIATQSIKVQIDSVYKGTKYEDCCISEIEGF